VSDDSQAGLFTVLLEASQDVGRWCSACSQFEITENPETRVLCAAIHYVADRICGYLEYFETEIEAGFGFSSSDEREKILKAVVDPFLSAISKDRDGSELDAKTNAVANLVLSWRQFPRQTVEDILQRSKPTD